MYTISFFGTRYQGTGTIGQICRDNNLDVGQQDPYVNNQPVSLDTTPACGSTVTFRPKSAGKANA